MATIAVTTTAGCRAQLLVPEVAVAGAYARVESFTASSASVFRRGSVPPRFSERSIFIRSTRSATGQPARLPQPRRTALRASASSPSVSTADEAKIELNEKLEGVKLYNPAGDEVPLLGLWEKRSAVVAFTRHFGCVLCRKRAALLESRKAELDAAGVALVVIAPGNSEQARKFIEQTNFSGEVYADPKHESYEALDFVKGADSVLNYKSASSIAAAYREGYRQDWKLSFFGDTVQRGGWQQGGILVAGPGAGAVKYLFKDKHAGDEPDLEEVMSACCAQ